MNGIMGQVLNIPVTCHPKHFPRSKYSFNSYEQNMHAPIVGGERMHWFWAKYVLGTEAEIGASPLLASSVDDLPPTRTSELISSFASKRPLTLKQ